MSQDTNVKNLIINKLTKEQYDNIQSPSPTELYFVTGGDTTITDEDIVAALGYTPESTANKVTTLSSSSTDTEYPSAKLVYDDLQECADLSNLSDLGNARLHALKGYSDEGEVLTDAEGLADVKDCAHSTFDLSKFSVTGTPTIIDGVVTSPTNSNYLYTTLSAGTLYNDLEINFNYVFKASGYICQHQNIGNSYMIYNSTTATELTLIYSNQGGTTKTVAVTINNFSFTAGVEYNVNIHVSGQSVRYKVTNLSNGTTKYADGSLENSYYVPTGFTKYFVLYNVQSANYKKAYINIDGRPYFSGNKTGIDTIKPADYTVEGSPTITDDGIVSGFTNANYITIPKTVIDSLIGHSWEIEIPVENIPVGSAGVCVLGAIDYGPNNIILGRGNTGAGLFLNIVNGTSNIVGGDTYVALNATDKGICYVGFDGSKYYIKLVLSTGTVRTDEYETTTEFTSKSSGLKLYYRCSSCALDSNKVKVRRDGNLIYQACLKIPYTEGFNGEKIANVAYRDRVQDAYNQGFTNALYFTLDEVNGNYTLPMGEIYGWMTQNSTGASAMPSERADTLVLGTSGSTYTAPANGYFYFASGNTGEIITLSTSKLSTSSEAQGAYIFLPVLEGDSCTASYSGTGASATLKFVYAEGSKYKKA